jgi:hypothetical protein
MRYRVAVAAGILSGLLVVLADTDQTEAQAQPQPEVTIEAIAKAWEQQQARVRSARFNWTVQATVPRGSLSAQRAVLGPRANPEGKILPPEDTTFDYKATLCLDGEQLRFEHNYPLWSREKGLYVSTPYVSVFGGQGGKSCGPRAPRTVLCHKARFGRKPIISTKVCRTCGRSS